MTQEGDVIPDVAARWDILDDGMTYVFHLRNDIRWSDGNPVTAKDFEYAWQRSVDSAFTSGSAPQFYEIRGARAFHTKEISQWTEVGVHAKDERTLVIELRRPSGTFLHSVTLSPYLPVPRHVVELQGDDWASSNVLISNGPFLLESWERLKFMTLIRNPDFHRQTTGNVGRIVMLYFESLRTEDDFTGLVALYESNQIDILNITRMSISTAESLVRRFAEDFITAPEPSTRYIALNPSKPPFDDINVRQAFAMAIDRETFARQVIGSMHDLATGGLIPPGMWGHSPGISHQFDPQQARMLLRKSLYSKESDFSHVIALYHETRADELLFPIKNWRQHLGLKISAQKISWPDLLQHVYEDPPHIYRLGWDADFPDPDTFLRTGISEIRAQWNHPQFEALIKKARNETDQSKRLMLYREADKILVDEAVIIPLVYQRHSSLVKPWIHNFPLAADDFPALETIIITDH